jgi:hypothetical protein
VLSVVVRWGPVKTAVNGTLVAWTERTTWHTGGALGSNLDPRVRPVLGDQASWASREGAAAARE